MPCETVAMKDGTPAILCSRGHRPRRRCSACQTAWATKECDFLLERRHAGNHKTCDKPLCGACAVKIGPDVDHCPDHPPVAGTQLTMEGL